PNPVTWFGTESYLMTQFQLVQCHRVQPILALIAWTRGGDRKMLSNDDMQRLQRLVNLAPLMTQEMQQGLLELVRKLKAAEGQACGLPASAIADLERAVPTELVQAIVEDQRHGVGVPAGFHLPSRNLLLEEQDGSPRQRLKIAVGNSLSLMRWWRRW